MAYSIMTSGGGGNPIGGFLNNHGGMAYKQVAATGGHVSWSAVNNSIYLSATTSGTTYANSMQIYFIDGDWNIFNTSISYNVTTHTTGAYAYLKDANGNILSTLNTSGSSTVDLSNISDKTGIYMDIGFTMTSASGTYTTTMYVGESWCE